MREMYSHLFRVIMATLLLVAVVALGLQAQEADQIEKIKESFPKLNKIQVPDVERVTLDNGLKLYLLVDKSLPVFNASVRVNCGTWMEPADKVGLASVCGSVMRTGGTEKWTGDELDEMLEGIGGAVETDIDMTSGTAFVNVLSEYSDMGLEVLAEVLRRPRFDEDKIELAKVEQRTAISRRNDEIGDVARREFVKQIYGADSPYARHTEYSTVGAITRDDLLAFHQAWYHPEQTQMAIWGDFDRDQIVAQVEKFFGDWPRGNVTIPEMPKVNYTDRSQVYYIPKPDAKQAYVRIGHLGGLVTDKDYTSRIVMNSILGGGFGSRVTDNVRTKLGLAYTSGGRYISNYTYPGYFFILASTKPGSTVQAAREMIKQIKSMHTDLPTPEEMAKGKDGYLNSFVFNFDSKREVINRMMEYDFYGLPEDFLDKEKEGVESVTPEAVMAAAKANIHPDQMIVIVAGKGEDFDEPLENLGLGPVDTLDITIPTDEEKTELALTPENLDKGHKLLGQALEAAGGLAAFKAINSIESVGKITIFMQGQSISGQTEEVRVIPDKSRSVTKLMGMEMLEIRDGLKGWKTDMQTMGLVSMSEEDLAEGDKSWTRSLVSVFRSFDDPYYQAAFDGNGNIDGALVDWVALVDDEGEVICRLAIDGSGSVLCSKYYGESPMGPGTMEQKYEQFTLVNGVKLPSTESMSTNGEKFFQSEVAKFTINGDVAADAFAAPN
ncbi:MAG: pitrilysin family protein [bacterium]